MTDRVTHRSIQESAMARLQGNLQSMALLQDQISSGRKITKPSDDPSGAVSSLALRQQLRLNEQHTRQGDDALSWLNAQDTALQTTSSQLNAARTLVVKALNTGASTDGTRTAISVELDGILQTVISLANTQYQGRNLFAGTSGEPVAVALDPDQQGGPVDPDAPGSPPTYVTPKYVWSTTGSDSTVDNPVTRQVDAQSAVRVDSNGARVFGTDAEANGVLVDTDDLSGARNQSLFSLLAQISAEVKTPKAAGDDLLEASGAPVPAEKRLATMLSRLDTATGKVLEGLADVGARYNRVERALDIASSARTDLTEQLSKIEDTDVPAALIHLTMQQTAYQAALKANSKVLNTSLMDFLS